MHYFRHIGMMATSEAFGMAASETISRRTGLQAS